MAPNFAVFRLKEHDFFGANDGFGQPIADGQQFAEDDQRLDIGGFELDGPTEPTFGKRVRLPLAFDHRGNYERRNIVRYVPQHALNRGSGRHDLTLAHEVNC